jgi:Nickel responsive protein SCO4226-like
MLYVAKCFWPGVTEREVERAAANAARVALIISRRGPRVSYRGAMVFPRDELVLCIFESSSRKMVIRASERAGIPCERLMESVWLRPPRA